MKEVVVKNIRSLNIKPGDKLFRPKSGFELFNHWGNYAGLDHQGRHWVFEHGEGGLCRLTLFDDFSNGHEVQVEKISDSEREGAVSRMKELLENPREYDLLGFNCQHAANYVGNGKVTSGQVIAGLCAFVIGILVVLKNKKVI